MTGRKQSLKEPELFVHCHCGTRYSLQVCTVCPNCFQWPSRVVDSEKTFGCKCRYCAGIGCVRCNGTGWESASGSAE